MPSHYICAYLAEQVYTDGGGNPPQGWELFGAPVYPQNRLNLGMAAYINRDTRELVVAFRGTDGIWDLISDFILWQRQFHPNQAYSEHQANRIIVNAGNELLNSLGNTYLQGNELAGAAVVSAAAVAATASSVNSSGWEDAAIRSASHYLANEERNNHNQLTQSLANTVRSERLSSITLVGHSMGGFLAEIAACRLYKDNVIPIRAVSFDSPGCRELINSTESYRNENYNFITTYLSAPNIVNTCHHHVGEEVYRIYIPHVEGGWTWGHAITSASQAAFRATAYVSPAIIAYSPAAVAAIAVAGSAAAAARIATGVIDITFRNAGWLSRQHSTANILACFDPITGLPCFYSRMQSWPELSGITNVISTQVSRTMRSLLPFQNDTPGLRTLLHENWMRENQINQLPNYIPRSDHGVQVEWVEERNLAANNPFLVNRR